MRILIASTAFPEPATVLRERLPADEIVVEAGRAEGSFDVIVPLMSRVGAQLMDRHRPRLIQQYGVGLEGVDREAARERGIPVGNVPAADTGNADGVGEVALIGAGTREGAAADEVRERLGLAPYVPVAELAQACDRALALVACCVLNDATRGVVGREVLAALGRGGPGYVVNVARGPVLDYDALHRALRDEVIAGAGLDVYWDEPVDPEDPILEHNVVANVERLRRGDPVVTAG